MSNMNHFQFSETDSPDEVNKALNKIVDKINENEDYNADVEEYNGDKVQKTKKSSGFSRIGLLLVIAIIAILAICVTAEPQRLSWEAAAGDQNLYNFLYNPIWPGDQQLGVSGSGFDYTWHGTTAGDYMMFVGASDLLLFEDLEVRFNDDTATKWGDTSEITFQYDEDGLDAGQWTGKIYGNKILPEIEAATSETVLNTESQKVFVTTADMGTVTYTLPQIGIATIGMHFTFVDISATSGDNIKITAASGDSINGGTVAKSYVSTSNSVPESVTLTAISGGSWVVTGQIGTWANDNN